MKEAIDGGISVIGGIVVAMFVVILTTLYQEFKGFLERRRLLRGRMPTGSKDDGPDFTKV